MRTREGEGLRIALMGSSVVSCKARIADFTGVELAVPSTGIFIVR